jgi:hypothetical protein
VVNKSFSARLAALEALDAAANDRVLCAFLQIRPLDYLALTGDDNEAADRVWLAYGLDQIAEGERVNIWGATWPYPMRPIDLTIYHRQDAEGYGLRVDVWPLYADAPAPGAWKWVVSVDEVFMRLRKSSHAEKL